jgi:hypothetical protein
VEEARRKARITLGQIAFGTDPIAEKRQAQLRALTLGEVYREFVKSRKPHLKPRTLYDSDLLLRGVFKDWQSKPITEIRKTRVKQRQRELGAHRGGGLRQPGDAFSASGAQFCPAPVRRRGRSLAPVGESRAGADPESRRWGTRLKEIREAHARFAGACQTKRGWLSIPSFFLQVGQNTRLRCDAI